MAGTSSSVYRQRLDIEGRHTVSKVLTESAGTYVSTVPDEEIGMRLA